MSDRTNIPGMESPYTNYNYGYDNPSPNTGVPFGAQGVNNGMYEAPVQGGGTVVGGIMQPSQTSTIPSMGAMAVNPSMGQMEGAFRPMQNPGKPIYGFLVSVSRVPTGEFWPVYQGNNTIGRDPSCDIILPEATVSRQHMSLIIRKNRNPEKVIAAVRDNGSSAGTMLNGQSLDFDVVECHSGDTITVGQAYELLFVLVDAASHGLKLADKFIPASVPVSMTTPQGAGGYPSAQPSAVQREIGGYDNQVPPSFRPDALPMSNPKNNPRIEPSDGTVGMDGLGGIGRGGTMS